MLHDDGHGVDGFQGDAHLGVKIAQILQFHDDVIGVLQMFHENTNLCHVLPRENLSGRRGDLVSLCLNMVK